MNVFLSLDSYNEPYLRKFSIISSLWLHIHGQNVDSSHCMDFKPTEKTWPLSYPTSYYKMFMTS